MGQRRQKIFDALLDVWSTHATIAGGAPSSGERRVAGITGSATPLYVDTGGGFTEGYMVVDISDTVEAVVASGFSAKVFLMGSTTSIFTTSAPLALLEFGDAYAIQSSGAQFAVGRYLTPFCNDFGGTIYRYLRMYCVTGGSGITGILFNGFLSK